MTGQQIENTFEKWKKKTFLEALFVFSHKVYELFYGFYCYSELKVTGKLTVKEHFVYTDSDGTLYHFLVEGNSFQDASKIPPEVCHSQNISLR